MLFTKLLFDQCLKAKKTSIVLEFLSRRTFADSINTFKSRQSGSLRRAEFHLVSHPLLLPLMKSVRSLGFSFSTLKMSKWSPQALPTLLVLILEQRQESCPSPSELENHGESSSICSSSTRGEGGEGQRTLSRWKLLVPQQTHLRRGVQIPSSCWEDPTPHYNTC